MCWCVPYASQHHVLLHVIKDVILHRHVQDSELSPNDKLKYNRYKNSFDVKHFYNTNTFIVLLLCAALSLSGQVRSVPAMLWPSLDATGIITCVQRIIKMYTTHLALLSHHKVK